MTKHKKLQKWLRADRAIRGPAGEPHAPAAPAVGDLLLENSENGAPESNQEKSTAPGIVDSSGAAPARQTKRGTRPSGTSHSQSKDRGPDAVVWRYLKAGEWRIVDRALLYYLFLSEELPVTRESVEQIIERMKNQPT